MKVIHKATLLIIRRMCSSFPFQESSFSRRKTFSTAFTAPHGCHIQRISIPSVRECRDTEKGKKGGIKKV